MMNVGRRRRRLAQKSFPADIIAVESEVRRLTFLAWPKTALKLKELLPFLVDKEVTNSVLFVMWKIYVLLHALDWIVATSCTMIALYRRFVLVGLHHALHLDSLNVLFANR